MPDSTCDKNGSVHPSLRDGRLVKQAPKILSIWMEHMELKMSLIMLKYIQFRQSLEPIQLSRRTVRCALIASGW